MELVKFLLFVALTACMVKVSHQGPVQHRLYQDLLKTYSSLVRPVNNDTQNVTVTLGLSLMQIMDVDEKKQVLTTNMWLQMNWDDQYLQWDPSEYPGVTIMTFPSNLLWKPDILLFNSADERFDAAFPTSIVVHSSGSCKWIPLGIFKSTCKIDVRWFPFDIQKCELKFGSWSHNGWSVDLKLGRVDLSSYIPNGEWDLVEVPGVRHEVFYTCCLEPYIDVTFTVVMRRRTLYYSLNLLIPCVLISILALLVFLLPADSGEKISLGITVLLSLVVFMLLVAEIMPPTSDSVPLIAEYFAIIMVIVGMSVIATVIVLRCHYHDPDGGKMPEWTRVILLNWCAWFLRMKRPGEDQVRSARNKGQRSSLASIDIKGSAPQSTNGNMLYMHGLENIPGSASSDPGVLDGCLSGKGGEDEMLLSVGQVNPVRNMELEMAKILNEVHSIANHFRKGDEAKSVCSEWKFAAAVIDRICLVLFFLVTILCTIWILMSAPNFAEAVSNDFLN
ncbi:neuronal acetylcholine receptor subunit alpha-7-like [Pholidichthys leucotaenia]